MERWMHILGTNAARVACCLTAVLFAAACGGPDTLVDGDLAFVNVNVLPMDQEQVLEDQTVIIADGRVVAMASADDIGPEENVEVVEGDGLYLHAGVDGDARASAKSADVRYGYQESLVSLRGQRCDDSPGHAGR